MLIRHQPLKPSNIAFIKYWGNRDQALRLPINGSISMNLGGLYARNSGHI